MPMLDLFDQIVSLKKQKNAVILAHYYQDDDVQDIADFRGDSLALAQFAKKTTADIIVFCGVHFMAETAKILNPHKKVLVPDLKAGCSLSDGCPAPQLQQFMKRYPDHVLISYINCSAEVKAMSDIICTSSNAVRVVNSIPQDKKIVFAPDRHLGAFVSQKTGRDMVMWPGSCFVHDSFSEKKLVQLKVRHEGAKVLAHPECTAPVLKHADFIGSTSAIIQYAANTPEPAKFIVVTEPGVIHAMKLQRPDHEYIPAPPEENCACNYCPHMRLNTLEKVYACLKDENPQIELPTGTIDGASRSLERMLELG